MGGTLDLASTPQQGSTFWVELPLVEGPVQRDERSGQAEAPAAEEPAEHSGPTLTVLYIEDNLSNLRLVERVLGRRPGVRLITAMRPQLRLDLAADHHPDLVLLDLHLPDMPGRWSCAVSRPAPGRPGSRWSDAGRRRRRPGAGRPGLAAGQAGGSRPSQVVTQASLPSGSARTQKAGASAS